MTITFILTTYLIATLWEHYLHKEILHAKRQKVKYWRNSGGKIGMLLYKGWYSHHVVHHKKTFQTEYHTQFDSKQQQTNLDTHLINKFNQTNTPQKYGLTINTFWEYVIFMLPWFIVAPISFYLGGYLLLMISTLILMLPLLLSKYIHPFLHEKKTQTSWIYNNVYVKKIYKTHRIHHEDDTKNFNLLLGGDWIMETYQNNT